MIQAWDSDIGSRTLRSSWALRIVLAAALLLLSSSTWAAPKKPQELFRQGLVALNKGDHDKAIASFERLADLGVTSNNVAFDRGLAYLQRVKAKAGHPGDLGQAAEAFEEALRANPRDVRAREALRIVRGEVAKRTARRAGKAVVTNNEPLDRMITRLLPEAVWAWGALLSSLALALGLVMRKRRSSAWQLAGLIATPAGAIGLLLFTPLAARARYLRLHTYPAVVVTADAQVVDERGHPRSVDPIPEAARVEVEEQQDDLVRVRHGQATGWVRRSSVRRVLP